MDLKPEVLAIPVSDVDESLAFSRGLVGFVLDHDVRPRA